MSRAFPLISGGPLDVNQRERGQSRHPDWRVSPAYRAVEREQQAEVGAVGFLSSLAGDADKLRAARRR